MADGAFNALAWRSGELWNRSTIGRLQREAVWRRLDRLFRPGDTLLDLGCGDGEDALHFMSSGMQVHGIDSSPEMVRVACHRGVHATQLAIEELGRLKGSFDGAISNFGAFNCLGKLDDIRDPLARLIRSGGFDRRVEHLPLVRALSDHRLVILARNSA